MKRDSCMIRNVEKWRKWEDDYIAPERDSHADSLRLADSMIALAAQFGVFPPLDPFDGMEHKIALAKALNVPINPLPSR